MRSAFNKDILRSITGSWGRFLAIVGIVALGCGFYAGLRMTAPDMDMSADAYYDDSNLMDIRVVSTLGLTDADIQALRDVPGVEKVEGAYETDVMVTLNDEQYAFRVHSLPYAAHVSKRMDESMVVTEGETQDSLNQLQLVEGRWPTAPDECVISADNVMNNPVSLGDVIHVDEGIQPLEDTLKERDYTIVGLAHSPYYVSTTAMGTTSLGSGSIDQFMYVPSNDFDADLPFTEAFIQVAGAKAAQSGSDAYQDCVDNVIKELHGIKQERETARLAQVKADAQEELDARRADYERERADAEAQLSDARQKLDDAAATIEESKRSLASGRADYDSGKAQLAQRASDADAQMADAQAQIDEKQQVLEASATQLEQSKAQLAGAWASAGLTPEQAPVAIQGLQAQLAALDPADPANTALIQELSAKLAALQALVQHQNEYESGQAAYDAGAAQLAQAQSTLDEQRSEARSQLASAQAQLDAALAKLEDGRRQLASGEEDYAAGLAEYEEEYAKAQDGFAEAEQKLADAQADIDAIERPEWLIMDRTKNPGVVSFASDADRVDSIAAFFPFIFFLVAALVALTTMTRMVEEERVLIGTFKALGYSRMRITSKYLIYAAVASITGSILGIVVLSLVLPPVIMEAYAIIYSVPHGILMPIDAGIALSSAGLGVGVTLIATWAAAASTLRETPAQLMLPRAPKQGKRILLERIAPLWRRVSFSWKVTFRNIFRYKKRLVMTVIGIAGCTGLLLTGLGLQDSINDIIDKQFGQTVKYNMIVTEDEDISLTSMNKVDEALSDEKRVFAQADSYDESMMAVSSDGSDFSVTMIVPEDATQYQKLWVMRTRIGQEPIPLDEDSVIITEKLGNELGLSVGDTLTLATQDQMGNATTDHKELTVTGIMENYIANYVFLGKGVYESAFGKSPVPNAIYAEVADDPGVRRDLSEELRAIDGVKTVAFNDETINSYRTMLRSVNMIVVVLVIAAAALAFIVLYNLTNINITERQREIATLKVLGFTPHEVDMYIYRETIILTMLGALIGLAFGVVLEGFVIVTAEVDYVMFGRDIHALSFVIAFIVTILFAVVVMLFMRKKLANINMIESLKSNE